MPGESQQVLANRPDPSVVTTENIDKAVDNLRAEVVAWLEGRDAVLRERDLRYTERFNGQETAVEAAFDSSEKAIDKAEKSIEKRADASYVSVQELSRSLAALMPRTETEALIRALGDKLSVVETGINERLSKAEVRVERIEATKTGSSEQRAALYATAGFVVALIIIGGFIAAAWPR